MEMEIPLICVKGHLFFVVAVLSHSTTTQVSQVSECAIDILTAGLSTRTVARKCNVSFSTRSQRGIFVCNKALLWGKNSF
jgi:hypothetical protein